MTGPAIPALSFRARHAITCASEPGRAIPAFTNWSRACRSERYRAKPASPIPAMHFHYPLCVSTRAIPCLHWLNPTCPDILFFAGPIRACFAIPLRAPLRSAALRRNATRLSCLAYFDGPEHTAPGRNKTCRAHPCLLCKSDPINARRCCAAPSLSSHDGHAAARLSSLVRFAFAALRAVSTMAQMSFSTLYRTVKACRSRSAAPSNRCCKSELDLISSTLR